MESSLIYHAGNRGVRRGLLYESPEDYSRFETLLTRYASEFNVGMIASCLMPNHDHLQIQCPPAVKSPFLQRLHWAYAWSYNKATERHGHVFEERSWSFERWGDAVVPLIAAYIFINPYLAGLVRHPAEYEYSTYGAMLGQRPVPGYLKPALLFSYFSPDPKIARDRLRSYVENYMAHVDYIREARNRWNCSHRSTARARNLASNVEILALTAAALDSGPLHGLGGLGKNELILIALNRFEGASLRTIAAALGRPVRTTCAKWKELQDMLKKKDGLLEGVYGALDQALLHRTDGRICATGTSGRTAGA